MHISNFNNGDTVQWSSAAGVLKGEVLCIRIGRNAANKMIPWLRIGNVLNVETGENSSNVELPGNGLAMYKIEKVLGK